jgi:DNA-binding transcriptional regulator GbsR (MarR family)
VTAERASAGHLSPQLSQFIERFAATLFEAGIPRMPARVFVALLTADASRLSAADLASRLAVSPAAISGATRYLIGVGMIACEGAPGSRRLYYLIPDDVWNQLLAARDRAMAQWVTALQEGVSLVGADSAAGRRMMQSIGFFEFVGKQLPAVLASWSELQPGNARAAGYQQAAAAGKTGSEGGDGGGA